MLSSQNLVLDNLNQAKKHDESVKDIFKGKHKPKDVDQNATFERFQSRNINVTCLQPRHWLVIEKVPSSEVKTNANIAV